MEKTFEKLIEEKMMTNFTEEHREEILYFKGKSIIDLMQQVRESTIAEVLKLCDENFFSKEPKGKLMENIENIQKDRIRIEP